jgi:hypothetical protein
MIDVPGGQPSGQLWLFERKADLVLSPGSLGPLMPGLSPIELVCGSKSLAFILPRAGALACSVEAEMRGVLGILIVAVLSSAAGARAQSTRLYPSPSSRWAKAATAGRADGARGRRGATTRPCCNARPAPGRR